MRAQNSAPIAVKSCNDYSGLQMAALYLIEVSVKKFTLYMLLLVLLLSMLFSAYAEESTVHFLPAKFGEESENVRMIQEKLIQLNYLNANPTGKFLEQTKEAIKQFQSDAGLEASGEMDEETAKALAATLYRAIEPGTNSKAVVNIQSRLIELGYLKTRATGNYKGQTEQAIKEFQKDNNLTVNGIADIATQELLFTKSAADAQTDPISVSDGRSFELMNEPFQKKLVRASEGEEVKKVQSRLTELGFFDGPISGYYMNQTMAAVKKFQSYNTLKANGLMDEQTWDALFNDSAVVDAMSTPAPTPEPTLPKYALTVDVTNQAVLAYEMDENGKYTKLVRKMICSTGTVATPSDVGDWVLNGRKANWCYFPAYGSHAKFWTQINKYIAFHSVIYNRVDNMALSVKSYNRLGGRASHGCVRLMVHDAQWIYNNTEKGTVVTITEDLPLDEELRYAIKQPLLNKSVMLPVSTPEPTPEPVFDSKKLPPMPLETLQKKSEGEAVFWLQAKLKELGYYTGTVTGTFYSGTENAVKKFQKDNGLYASGKADVETLDLLYRDVLHPETPTPPPTVMPILAPSPSPELSQAPPSATPAP